MIQYISLQNQCKDQETIYICALLLKSLAYPLYPFLKASFDIKLLCSSINIDFFSKELSPLFSYVDNMSNFFVLDSPAVKEEDFESLVFEINECSLLRWSVDVRRSDEFFSWETFLVDVYFVEAIVLRDNCYIPKWINLKMF